MDLKDLTDKYLAVRRLGHCLHGLQISDLHGRSRRQDIGGLAHELGTLNFGARADDLGFSGPLGLRGHGQRVLQLLAEDDVFDQHRFDCNTPAHGGFFDDFADGLGDLFATLDHVLKHAGTDYVAESRLGALDQGLADVGDAESCLVLGGGQWPFCERVE